MILFLLFLGEVSLVVTAYFLIRLNWVKNFQTTVLMRSPAIYMHLPKWKVMLFHKWWVWEDTVFLPDPDSLRRE